MGVHDGICRENGTGRDQLTTVSLRVPAVEAVAAASERAGQERQPVTDGRHAADGGRAAVAVKENDKFIDGNRLPDGMERDIRCHHDSAVGDHAAVGAERPAAELHIHGRDKAAGGKGIAAALFNGDRLHAARARRWR